MNSIKSVNELKFNDRLKCGKFGEQKAIEFFDLKGFKYEDVSDVLKYQIIEVDFLVEVRDKMEMLEVKTFKNMIIDREQLMIKYKTEYLDEELKSKKGDDSWLYRTEAKYIMFICKKSNRIIIITTEALREYIERFKDTKYIRKQKYFDEDLQDNGKYDSYNYVYYISIKHLYSEVNASNGKKMKIYNDLECK